MSKQAYLKLEKRFRRIGVIRDINEVLHWDNATKMPAGGGTGTSVGGSAAAAAAALAAASPRVVRRLTELSAGSAESERRLRVDMSPGWRRNCEAFRTTSASSLLAFI